MRIDESRRQHQPRALDDPVLVRVEVEADRSHDAAVDANVDDLVDSLGGIEHP